jgi:hypothetical protein
MHERNECENGDEMVVITCLWLQSANQPWSGYMSPIQAYLCYMAKDVSFELSRSNA